MPKNDSLSLTEWRNFPRAAEYQVSSCGQVKKLGKIKKLTKHRNGYLVTGISIGKRRYTYCVHRLVAETFMMPQPPGTEINHKDGNKANNSVSNLEWVTRKENIRHAFSTGLNKVKKKLTEREIDSALRLLECGESQGAVAARFGVHQSTISRYAKERFSVAR